MEWKKMTNKAIRNRVFKAIDENQSYFNAPIIGVPATYLDEEVFYSDAPFLRNAPFISTMISNPNHIGVHTFEDHKMEDIFAGTQALEVELIRMMAENMFNGKENAQDGYVAAGGTEANIQALWIYRNYFIREKGASIDEIAIVYSADSHYSMPKGANVLNLQSIILDVDFDTRQIIQEDLERKISDAKKQGIKHFIVNVNMSTTMFGSVDDVERISAYFNVNKLDYKLHVDGAFGGFIHPFTKPDSPFGFHNPNISSITVDAHKMLQAPYGTGVFLCRKGLMDYTRTEEASYVQGLDFTLSGSRSGANAVSVWMIMMAHGPDGLKVRMQNLADKAHSLKEDLDELGVEAFHQDGINIVTIKDKYIQPAIAKKYRLVSDNYGKDAKWWKIVVMKHVTQGTLDQFVEEINQSLA
jgi:glutamate/tyrosine decarboxylase-like PLP-dependent enzyme